MKMFYNNDLIRAYKRTKNYAGKEGRVATMPDVIAEKIKADEWNPVWTNYLMTTSGEFYGKSKGGVEIVVIVHGIQEILDSKEIVDRVEEYFIQNNRTFKYIPLNQKEFHELEGGKFGDPSVLEYYNIVKTRKSLGSTLNYIEAWKDPLLRARLGKDTDTFLSRHRKITKKESGNDLIIENSRRYPPCIKESDMNTGGLLRISQLCDFHRTGEPSSVSTEVSLTDLDAGRFMAIRGRSGK